MRLRGLNILLVEDDIDNLELLASFLDDEGACTFSAGSIAAALAQTAGKPLDLVISDLELADGDGCGLLAALKQQSGRELPAIAITGYSDQKWRNKAHSCGFVHYAVKPYSLELLVDWAAELSARPQNAASADSCQESPDRAARVLLAR